jgi:hypothetical protein
MADSVLTLCPNCGRRLHVAQYQEMVTCTSCKQVSKIQYPWGVHQPKPEPPRQTVMQQVMPEKRGSDNRVLWLVLILGLVLATAGAVTFGVILPRLRAAEQPAPPPDYFVDATDIPDELVRVLGFPAMVQRLTIFPDRAEVEAWDSEEGVVKRHLVRPAGTTTRRGGKSARGTAFDASELEFSRVPAMVADALSTVMPKDAPAPSMDGLYGMQPDAPKAPATDAPGVHNIVVERLEGGPVVWRVSVRGKAGVQHVDYDIKGNRLTAAAP